MAGLLFSDPWTFHLCLWFKSISH
uniref:Uncharacterized protein n=1 Tax=Anguilla anguilla TaxID=7936 RepID=A0A0E9W886_ANGAN